MKQVKIITEYITLGQLLKFLGIVSSGHEVKQFLNDETVFVNGEQEQRRGRKLYKDYQVLVKGVLYIIDG